MTDPFSASTSFDAPAGQAEPTSAPQAVEGTATPSEASADPVLRPADASPALAAVHAVPLAAPPGEAKLAPELPSAEAEYGPPPQTFAEMGLREDVLRALTEMGFTEPMPVQRRTYRPMMAGRDLIVQSRTGSGKTAAFGIPFLQGVVDPDIDSQNGRIQALVLGPTRELALQVATELGRIATHCKATVTAVYGGAPMGKQIEALKAGSQIVAGTPGRVLDHLRRGTLHLSSLRAIVLDEADEMLSMGFLEDIIEVLRRCPTERQTLLFSATMPDEVVRLAQRYQRSPLMLALSSENVGASDISHAYYMVSGMGRSRDLLRVLQIERPDSAMIFCNTREETSTIAEFLRNQGFDAEPISSDLNQSERERVMGRMRAKNLHYLVATDVAARGIDISDLSHVINYTFPESAEVYVHRTGRTGRAGKSGTAISLISPRELGNFYYLKLTYKIRPEERTLPSEAELQTLREGQHLDRLLREFADRTPTAEFRACLKRVQASEEGERLLALLLEHYLAGPPAAIVAPAARPSSSRQAQRDSSSHDAGEPARRERSRDRSEDPTADSRREPPREPRREREPQRSHDGPRPDPDSRRRGRSRDDDARTRPHPEGPRRSDGQREPSASLPIGESAPGVPADGPSPTVESPRPPRPRSRPAGPPAPSSAAAAPGPGVPSPNDIINVEDGRDFWEAWVDARQSTGAGPAEAAAPPADSETDSEGRSRRRRRERPEYVPTPGEVRLYLNLGRRDQVSDESLVEFLTERGQARYTAELHSTHTYLFVPEAQADQVIAALSGAMHGTRSVLCERARR